MTVRRVGILGGGPAGLYAARLLKLRRPGLEVVVHERNHPGETFGFGVALTGATQRNLAAADPESWEAIRALGRPMDAQEFRLPGGRSVIRGGVSLGIGRAALLTVLLHHAERVGVRLELAARAPGDVDGDAILACDGVNSATRAALADELGVRVALGRGLYLWCGTDVALPHSFIPVTTGHGTFVAHAYPYAADRSTVLIETDEATWRRAGFDATTAALEDDRSGASDEDSLRYLEAAFAAHLDGHPLLGNRTRWLRFPTVTCRRWHHRRTVLLGDAAHTAHYSLGSGTKLAMEDAIALAAFLADADDVEQAFAAYEAERRPAVTRLQALALRSQRWWESFAERRSMPADRMAVAFMTRAGNVSLEQLAVTNPELVPGPAEDPTTWALEQPFVWRGHQLPSRVLNGSLPEGLVVAALPAPTGDAWGPEGDAVVAAAQALVASGADGLRLTGSDERAAVLDRLELSERLRVETGALLIVEGAAELRADLAAGLVSGRADLVVLDRVGVGAAAPPHRIGLVVPSSNLTVETELPLLLSRHPHARFTFHGSRMRMTTVSADELAVMNTQSARCVDELADAGVDALLYGCLVAVMAEGPRPAGAPESDAAHRRVEAALTAQLHSRGVHTLVASSAGALVESLDLLGASAIALVTPYLRPLAEMVVAYLEAEGLKVADWRALEVADNAAVGCIPGDRVMAAARTLDLSGVDALVISACVQMPSLDLVQAAEDEFGLPVLSATTAAAYVLLRRLGLSPVLPGAGSLLAGDGTGASPHRGTVLIKETR